MSIFKKLFSSSEEKPKEDKLYSFPIAEIIRETEHAISLVFDKPKEGFDFIPGQYLTLQLTLNGKPERRAYSLCNLPTENQLKVTVKETPDGYFSKHINRELEVGDLVEVLPPRGNFTFEADVNQQRHIVCFAGGSGITPIFSILQSALENEPNSKVTLFYGNRRQDDIIFKKQLHQLEQNYTQFELIHILSDEEPSDFTKFYGFIDAEKVKQFANTYFSTEHKKEFYLCGPGTMTTVISDALLNGSFDKKQIHTELFSAPLEQGTTNNNETSNGAEVVVGAKIVAKYGGETKEFTYNDTKQSILDLALDNGVKAPFSCLNGVCSTCSAKLKSGTVTMDQNFALEEEELNEGYILTCQSHPTSAKIEVDWDDNRV